MPIIIGLPHGVSLPRTFTEPEARRLVSALARTYQWTGPLFGRAEVEAYMREQAAEAATAHTPTLSASDWQRVQNTTAWKSLPTTARRAIAAADIIGTALRQAGLNCRTCDKAITGPPTTTWGLCPACLITADLKALQAQPCPAGDGATPHRWEAVLCAHCGMPAPPPALHVTTTHTPAAA